jgi:hypothetical protein
MNAQAKVEKAKKEPDNLRVWNVLAKTDPRHTKPFKRAGGFSGTAVKPIWVVKRLTELFGPCGEGWGIGEPSFQVVTGDNREVMVYCTVSCWHGSPENVLYGVGGDKIVTHIKANAQYNRPERWENDDEAFKKAFTDAVNNAFKFVGVAADVHMGQFDDSKYLKEVAAEFAEKEAEPAKREKLSGPYTSKTALWGAVKAFVHAVNGFSGNDELIPYLETEDVKALLEQCGRDAPGLLRDGLPDVPEYEPLEIFIARKKREFEEIEDIHSNTRTVIDAG